MAFTKVQVVSNALMMLGKRPIITLDNQDALTTAAEQMFDFNLPSVLSTGFWRFATTIIELSLTVPAPVGGYWNYAYEIPPNYLKLVHLWPQMYDYEVYENYKLYSNFNNQGQPLFMEYIFMPVLQNFPDYFWYFFAVDLALSLTLTNAQSVQYQQALLPEREKRWGMALAADAQNRPNTPLQNAPMISKRYISTFAGG
jgi:hypothetical protein